MKHVYNIADKMSNMINYYELRIIVFIILNEGSIEIYKEYYISTFFNFYNSFLYILS